MPPTSCQHHQLGFPDSGVRVATAPPMKSVISGEPTSAIVDTWNRHGGPTMSRQVSRQALEGVDLGLVGGQHCEFSQHFRRRECNVAARCLESIAPIFAQVCTPSPPARQNRPSSLLRGLPRPESAQDPNGWPRGRRPGSVGLPIGAANREKTAHPVCGLTPTLTARVRQIKVPVPITMNLRGCRAVQLTVVALPEPPVLENRYGRAGKPPPPSQRLSSSPTRRWRPTRRCDAVRPASLRWPLQPRRDGPVANPWLFPSRCPQWLSGIRRQSLWPWGQI